MTDEDRKALCMILRLAAEAVRVGVTCPPPIDNAALLVYCAGKRSNETLRRWAWAASAWANGGYAVGYSDNIAATMLVAADAVEDGRWVPLSREGRVSP